MNWSSRFSKWRCKALPVLWNPPVGQPGWLETLPVVGQTYDFRSDTEFKAGQNLTLDYCRPSAAQNGFETIDDITSVRLCDCVILASAQVAGRTRRELYWQSTVHVKAARSLKSIAEIEPQVGSEDDLREIFAALRYAQFPDVFDLGSQIIVSWNVQSMEGETIVLERGQTHTDVIYRTGWFVDDSWVCAGRIRFDLTFSELQRQYELY